MKIYIGSDHAGFELKGKLIEFLKELEYEVVDKGAFELNANDDYPDFVRPVASAVASDPEGSRGIIIGKSGQGEAMCANRVKGVRAIVFYGPPFNLSLLGVLGDFNWKKVYENIIKLSREHNNSNVLSLASSLRESVVRKVVKLWLETPFSGDERHIRRIGKLDA